MRFKEISFILLYLSFLKTSIKVWDASLLQFNSYFVIFMIQNYYKENKGVNQFLLAENKLLSLEVTELKQILAINRQSLRACIQFKQGKTKLPAIIDILYQQNTKLLNRLNNLTHEVDQKLCQALISDQIAMQFQRQQKWVIESIRSQLSKLKKLLHKRQVEISQLKAKTNIKNTHHTQQDYQSFTSSPPQMSNMLINESLTILRSQLSEKMRQIQRIKQEKQELVKLNLILTKKLSQFQQGSYLGHNSGTKQSFTSKTTQKRKDYSQFISYQKRMQGSLDGSDSQTERQQFDFDSDSEKICQEDIHISLNQKSKFMVPKLQLTKAKELQSRIVEQINKQLKKKNSQQSKIGQNTKHIAALQAQIDKLKKQLGCIVEQKISQENSNRFLKRLIKELECRNSLLCQSQQNKQILHQAHKRQQIEKQTLIDICRDIVMNQELNLVLDGKIKLKRKPGIWSFEV